MKKYLIIFLLALAACGTNEKRFGASEGYIANHVTVTRDTTFIIEPQSDNDRWAIDLSWYNSTAGTSSVTVVTIQEGIIKNRWNYYASTDTLEVDTTSGSKFWKGSSLASNYIGIKVGTFSGTTTSFSISYSVK